MSCNTKYFPSIDSFPDPAVVETVKPDVPDEPDDKLPFILLVIVNSLPITPTSNAESPSTIKPVLVATTAAASPDAIVDIFMALFAPCGGGGAPVLSTSYQTATEP